MHLSICLVTELLFFPPLGREEPESTGSQKVRSASSSNGPSSWCLGGKHRKSPATPPTCPAVVPHRRKPLWGSGLTLVFFFWWLLQFHISDYISKKYSERKWVFLAVIWYLWKLLVLGVRGLFGILSLKSGQTALLLWPPRICPQAWSSQPDLMATVIPFRAAAPLNVTWVFPCSVVLSSN